MARYLIDVNLPYYFNQWKTTDYIHQIDIDARWKDKQIWEYAKDKGLTIITKDSDFSNRILLNQPPPKIIHIRTGNMEMDKFSELISKCWEDVLLMSNDHKLVTVFYDHIEGVK